MRASVFFCVVGGSEQEFDKAQELGLPKLVMVRGTDNSKREEREAHFLERGRSIIGVNKNQDVV